jgi:hypothetical protein
LESLLLVVASLLVLTMGLPAPVWHQHDADLASHAASGSGAVGAHGDPDPTVLLPPTHLVGHYNATTQTVSLRWEPPVGDANPERTYNVYRNGVPLNTSLEALSFVDGNMPDDHVLLYQVTAVYSHGPTGDARASARATSSATVWQSLPVTCDIVVIGWGGVGIDWECIG